jgi:hypothetical protein
MMIKAWNGKNTPEHIQHGHVTGQYYTDDQYLNIYSFSLLYKWLYHCSVQSQSTPPQNIGSGSPSDTSPEGSVASSASRNSTPKGIPKKSSMEVSDLGSPQRRVGSPVKSATLAGAEGSPRSKLMGGGDRSGGKVGVGKRSGTVSRALQSLLSRSVDYCFRLMDQCERSKHNFNLLVFLI